MTSRNPISFSWDLISRLSLQTTRHGTVADEIYLGNRYTVRFRTPATDWVSCECGTYE